VPAYPDQAFTGTVSAVAPAIDQKTRTASVRVQPQDDGGKLKPGMLAQVGIITATQSDALLVPREAVIGTPASNAQATVVVLDGGRAQRTSVTLGLVSDRSVEVKSGLNDGQVVAIGNTNGLNNGDAVVPQLRTALAPTGVQ
jgi:multidrug efflux pump subunit AcrA (membrane-fusion protein)